MDRHEEIARTNAKAMHHKTTVNVKDVQEKRREKKGLCGLSCWRRHLVRHLGLEVGQLLIPLISEFPLSLQ